MTFTINTDELNKNNITLEEVLYTYLDINGKEQLETISKLARKRLYEISYDKYGNKWYTASKELMNKVNNVLLNSGTSALLIDKDYNKSYMDELPYVAEAMIKLFPKGKKEGTNMYWSESVPIIAHRLNSFYERFPIFFKSEDIIQATKNYVSSFNDTTTMRTLKYFIFKEEKTDYGVEYTSDLLTYLENLNEEVSTNPFNVMI